NSSGCPDDFATSSSRRSDLMAGRKRRGKRVANLGAAILVLAGLAQLQPISPRRARAGERRHDTPMAPALAVAIRDADAQAVGRLIEAGMDVNARDAEGNTPL